MTARPPLYLFLPFYTPRDPERAAELVHCLKANLDCGQFAAIHLLQDDDSPRAVDDAALKVVRLAARPTYLDWVRLSRTLAGDGLSILANSDIHFDASAAKFRDLFAALPNAFVALTRHDQVGDARVPHPNPHWSQDTWAFDPRLPLPDGTETQLDIPLGVPRCDNKIAYVFSVAGRTIVNPMSDIVSVHVHETGLRYYDKRGDARVAGTVANVHASPDLTTPAKLELEVWSRDTTQYAGVKINATLERWARQRHHQTERDTGILAHDADWQYPAVTEAHALDRMRALADPARRQPGVCYLGFPWATLIDLRGHGDRDRAAALEDALDKVAGRARAQFDRIVTVCQHIRAAEHAELFARAGVTDLFWSHMQTGRDTLPGADGVRLAPFPLYPVQRAARGDDAARAHLFSFVGAGRHKSYMTGARGWILDHLSDAPGGVVIGRDGWHYQKIVYDRQIRGKAAADAGLTDDDAAQTFRDIMARSVFALCPSGTGPNSIRLWEAVAAGAIPVVMADTLAPPRADHLWPLATLSCPETEEAVKALPDRLARLAADPQEMRLRRVALDLLEARYGTGRFVHDILAGFWDAPDTDPGPGSDPAKEASP